MTPDFLRGEAARFREMARTADREASKLRFLAMAADFESRAGVPGVLTEPPVAETIKVRIGKKSAKEQGAVV